MVRRITCMVALALLAASEPLAAQQAPRPSVSAGLTQLDFSGFGGPVGTAVITGAFALREGQRVSPEAVVIALLPSGRTSIQPSCIVGSVCQSRMTPSTIGAGTLGVRVGGRGRLGMSAGVGALYASGVEGSEQSAGLLALGADWTPLGNRGLLLTLRAVRLSRDVAGMRQFVLPGVGVAF